MKKQKIYILISKWDDRTEHIMYAINNKNKAEKQLEKVQTNKKIFWNINYYLKEIDLYTL